MNPMQKLAIIVLVLLVIRGACWLVGLGFLALLRLLSGEGRRLPAAPAVFLGWQEMPGGEAFPLFNLTAAIPGHSLHSSVSAATLVRAGYRLPAFPSFSPKK